MQYPLGAMAALALSCGAAMADGERLQPDFTFRRVAVPSAGARPVIDVQIDPDAPSAIRQPNSHYATEGEGETVLASNMPGRMPAALAAVPRLTGLEWFWQAVSPEIDATGPAARLQQALAALAAPPQGSNAPTPSLDTLKTIAVDHGREILTASIGTDISPALILAVIAVESAGNPTAESHAGAVGLMQLMPAAAERFGVSDRTDTLANIRGGTQYLDWLMDEFNGDALMALAGYNSGEGAVRRAGGVPPYPETRAYVPKVLAAWRVARSLCQTPPELLSDGCVFTVNNL